MNEVEAPKPHSESRWRFFFRFIERGVLLVAGSAGLAIWGVMLTRILSDVHPAFELVTHFSFHAWVGCIGLLLVQAILYAFRRRSSTSRDRWRRRLIFVAVPFLFFTWIIAPWRLIPTQTAKTAPDSIKVLAWNVLLVNERPAEIVELIEREKPDIVALIEVNPEMDRRLKQLVSVYASQYSLAAWNAGGMFVMTRFPDAKFEVLTPGNYWMPAIEMTVRPKPDSPLLKLLSIHTLSPKPASGERTSTRDNQLADIARWSAEQLEPSVVVGDFNVSPWSPPFWRMLTDGKLRDASWGFGYFPSFPAKAGLGGIPIDHALVNDQIEVLSRKTLYEPHDSDHCPVIMEFRVRTKD